MKVPLRNFLHSMNARPLRELSLLSGYQGEEWATVPFISLPFLWDIITTLDIRDFTGRSLHEVIRGLAKCTSLERLSSHFELAEYDSTIMLETIPYSPECTLYFLSTVPSLLAKTAPMVWENITSLDLVETDFIDGDDLISALQQVLSWIPSPFQVRCRKERQTLRPPSHLYADFNATVYDQTWIFRHMVVPSLKNLHICFQAKRDLMVLRDMVVSSGCALLAVHLDCSASPTDPKEWYIPGLHDGIH
ncbi:hypothetical protein DXG03_000327 [Asterophora parasitica]|uniref:Uncharacterized protein n=1 Tax=Asterophora parasitica TaxID=117018 RepID=A0A9P7GI41_9AGAR|nr:hypothetical protein DXG03_000327 [Asterophora parasitica]